jgi:hypothetical protein
MILNLDAAPEDSIERLIWLSGVKEQALKELDAAYQTAYYEARLSGRFDLALRLGLHSKARALKMTRRENNSRGRSLRWGDGEDPTSSAYGG